MMLKNWASLYTRPTAAEQAIEPAIAALGERYRAQHPFFALRAIVDFALLDRKTVVEIDGKSHLEHGQKIKDLLRTMALLRLGWRVVRIWNDDAMSDPAGALARALSGNEDTIDDLAAQLRLLQQSAPHTPAPPKSRREKGTGKEGKSKDTTPKP